jgi:hypothetical protein
VNNKDSDRLYLLWSSTAHTRNHQLYTADNNNYVKNKDENNIIKGQEQLSQNNTYASFDDYYHTSLSSKKSDSASSKAVNTGDS